MINIKTKTIENPKLSEMNLFKNSPGYSYKKIPGVHNCRIGWNINEALYHLKHVGASDTIKISGYQKLDSIDKMKDYIDTKGPLVSIMEFYSDLLFYRKGIYRKKWGNILGGHAICVVGYNEIDKVWICKNSWSTLWGDRGYLRIPYNHCSIDNQMWAIVDIVIKPHN